jgi:hypothetical protein
MSRPPVVAGGSRVGWPDLPPRVRRTIERLAGAPVTHAASQPGGFSPGLAARLLLADGRRCFAKSVDATAHPTEGTFHRAECQISAALPTTVPAPRLLASHDDADALDELAPTDRAGDGVGGRAGAASHGAPGDRAGGGDWVSLVFEDVAGRQPPVPWRPDDLARVLDAMTDLAGTLTPAPVRPPPAPPRLGGWHDLAAAPATDRLVDRLARLAPGTARDLDALVALEAGWPEAARGGTLLHFDLHAHNILLTTGSSGGVVFVDWPHARVGAAWLDLVILLCGVATGGTDPEPYARRHPLLRGVEPAAVDAALAALAGFWLGNTVRRAPPGRRLLRLRSVQLSYGRAALRWLGGRTGLAR